LTSASTCGRRATGMVSFKVIFTGNWQDARQWEHQAEQSSLRLSWKPANNTLRRYSVSLRGVPEIIAGGEKKVATHVRRFASVSS
jgi:hypothetical protein